MTVVGPPSSPSASARYDPPGDGNALAAATPTLNCTTSKFAPISDTLAAAVYIPSGLAMTAYGAGIYFDDSNADGGYDPVGGVLMGTGVALLLLAIPYVASAIYGFRNVKACRAAHASRGY